MNDAVTAITIAMSRAKVLGERNSCEWVLDSPDRFELLFERIERGQHDQTLRELCVEALRVACREHITDEDYRQVGRIAERMVKDAAVKVCNEYQDERP